MGVLNEKRCKTIYTTKTSGSFIPLVRKILTSKTLNVNLTKDNEDPPIMHLCRLKGDIHKYTLLSICVRSGKFNLIKRDKRGDIPIIVCIKHAEKKEDVVTIFSILLTDELNSVVYRSLEAYKGQYKAYVNAFIKKIRDKSYNLYVVPGMKKREGYGFGIKNAELIKQFDYGYNNTNKNVDKLLSTIKRKPANGKPANSTRSKSRSRTRSRSR